MMKTLVIGYGNPYRQDDGVAWHILQEIARMNNLPARSLEEGFQPCSADLDLWSVLQILPEMAPEIAKYDRVCFIDAHTGAVPGDVSIKKVIPTYSVSPMTHHLTPESLLSITEAIHHVKLEALLVSVRGHEFGFVEGLSASTSALVPVAVQSIQAYILRQKSDMDFSDH